VTENVKLVLDITGPLTLQSIVGYQSAVLRSPLCGCCLNFYLEHFWRTREQLTAHATSPSLCKLCPVIHMHHTYADEEVPMCSVTEIAACHVTLSLSWCNQSPFHWVMVGQGRDRGVLIRRQTRDLFYNVPCMKWISWRIWLFAVSAKIKLCRFSWWVEGVAD